MILTPKDLRAYITGSDLLVGVFLGEPQSSIWALTANICKISYFHICMSANFTNRTNFIKCFPISHPYAFQLSSHGIDVYK
jgi:hypothetical protein